MDKDVFVQNVKFLCLQRDIKPTNACKESGVGGSFISDIERGRTPSVAKVQQLAAYLGTTTSELLGETHPRDSESALTQEDRTLLACFHALNEEGRERLMETADDMVRSGKYIKIDSDEMGKKAE